MKQHPLRGLGLVLAMSFTVSPRLAVLTFGELVGKVLSALVPLFIGIFAAGAVAGDLRQMLLAAAALVGSTAVNNYLQVVGTSARVDLMERVGFAFDEKIARITGESETVDHLESPKYLDQLQILRDEGDALGAAYNMTLNIVNTVGYTVTILIVAGTADWRLLALALFGAPRLLASSLLSRWGRQAEEQGAAPSRLARHLVDLTTTPTPGAELRVFGLQRRLVARTREALTAWRRPGIRLAGRAGWLDAAFSILFFGAAAGLLVWMTSDVLGGSATIQSLVVALTVVRSLEGVSGTVSNTVQGLLRVVRNTDRYLWLEGYAAEVAGRHQGRAPLPAALTGGLRLDRVSFRYGGAERDSLSEVTLDLAPGTVIAVVGENGAGKSTLVKVLAGLYEPTAGRVMIDGVDLADYDTPAWRRNIAAAFQDNARFEFTAGTAIGLGDVTALTDRSRIDRAVEIGAAGPVLAALPWGLDTQLGTSWDDGVTLSGGQWQRLAISRSMMRPSPLLLILDEPTSALDAATEHELFDRYAAAARRARERNAITLLVTHRFSTVAAADLVVVLEHGKITELGSHAELIAAGGHYAELYELQAAGYR
ncbi:ABC transporter ATP-binding protein [Microlunatus speluncae]|uniref:ABC transporter ATP-binding protein n=1 Tax=Microlunatus speluncae TaxID=2594267 RepID=UPI0012665D2A|nr:ABC transporter ATP-binding protein [Microlunatus speluncae]